ncbi:MAG: alpha/beta hydrolase [Ilumatobacteraceae bacterium]
MGTYNGTMLVTTKDSTTLAVDVWGAGRPVVLLHAWGLDAHMWNAQLPALLGAGLQVVTIDQRGHGRSGRSQDGYDLDTMAADVIGVLDALDLHDAVLVGHSMGGAVVAHAIGALGTPRVGRAVLSAPITPCLTIGPDNALGMPAEAFAANRAAMAADIAGWLDANSAGYWGVGEDRWPLHTRYTVDSIARTPLPVLLATNAAITSADLRAEVATIAVPTLVIQGDHDLSAPIEVTGRPTAALLPDGRLHVIEGAGHGLYTSHAAEYDAALLDFIG